LACLAYVERWPPPENVAKYTRPIHHDAANAVGLAIAKVSGEVDVIEILEGKDEKAVLASSCDTATKAAIDAGAAADDVKIVAIEKIALQYTSNRATRIMVKAVGRLAVPGTSADAIPQAASAEVDDSEEPEVEGAKVYVPDATGATNKPSLNVDVASYRPEVRDGVWYISEVDLELIATGTGIPGTGGGGPSYHAFPTGCHYEIPVIDGDSMGRTYPTMHHGKPVHSQLQLSTQ
jgi:hypothetical protein